MIFFVDLWHYAYQIEAEISVGSFGDYSPKHTWKLVISAQGLLLIFQYLQLLKYVTSYNQVKYAHKQLFF